MPQTSNDLLTAACTIVGEVSPQQVHDQPERRTIIDVRERGEWDQGHVAGAIHLPEGDVETQIADMIPDRSIAITVYCAAGVRSLLAARAMHEMGYVDVTSLAGGLRAWKAAGYKVVVSNALTPEQRLRYRQHLMVPEIGEKGQVSLLHASVLLIGVGGLGSPAALYLAAAGIGTLGLVDFDTVDVSNLQRQILHSQDRVGMRKTASARVALTSLNPAVRINEHTHVIDGNSAPELFREYDVIINGCDNFPTRYLVNDVAVFERKPLIDGGVFRFEGYVNTIVPFASPCYRCRYPTSPSVDDAPSCSEAGVVGVLPGIVGVLQATEAIKLILGVGDPLTGRVLHIDARDMKFREFRVARNPGCLVCGENPSIKEPIDYVNFCAGFDG